MIARLRLELKNQRIVYFVPATITLILIPLVIWARYTSISGEDIKEYLTRLYTIDTTQMFVPLFSVWWPIFVMKEYLNSPGNEVLFAYRFGWDTLLMRCLALWLWYGIHWSLVCIAASFLIKHLIWLWIMVMLQSFMLIALAYFLAMLAKNTFLPLLLAVLYCLACLLFQVPLSIFSLEIHLEEPAERLAEMTPALHALPVGAVLFAAGGWLESRLWKKGK